MIVFVDNHEIINQLEEFAKKHHTVFSAFLKVGSLEVRYVRSAHSILSFPDAD